MYELSRGHIAFNKFGKRKDTVRKAGMLKAVIRVCVTNPRYDEEWAKFAKTVRKVQSVKVRQCVAPRRDAVPVLSPCTHLRTRDPPPTSSPLVIGPRVRDQGAKPHAERFQRVRRPLLDGDVGRQVREGQEAQGQENTQPGLLHVLRVLDQVARPGDIEAAGACTVDEGSRVYRRGGLSLTHMRACVRALALIPPAPRRFTTRTCSARTS